MEEELNDLNKKIRYIVNEKQIPDEIRKKIDNVYKSYRTFYESYLKNDMEMISKGVAARNVEEYFDANYVEAIKKVEEKYKERCSKKVEEIAKVLSTLEEQRKQIDGENIDKIKRSRVSECIKNDREDYGYITFVTDTVIDSIENSRNQLFRTLESLGTTRAKNGIY